jgi:hypothetical protein
MSKYPWEKYDAMHRKAYAQPEFRKRKAVLRTLYEKLKKTGELPQTKKGTPVSFSEFYAVSVTFARNHEFFNRKGKYASKYPWEKYDRAHREAYKKPDFARRDAALRGLYEKILAAGEMPVASNGEPKSLSAFMNASQQEARRKEYYDPKNVFQSAVNLLTPRRRRELREALHRMNDFEIGQRFTEFGKSRPKIRYARVVLAPETIGNNKHNTKDIVESLSKEELALIRDMLVKGFPSGQIFVRFKKKLPNERYVAFVRDQKLGGAKVIEDLQERYKRREQKVRDERLRKVMRVIKKKRRIQKSDVYLLFQKEDKDAVRGWIKKWVDVGTLIEVKDEENKCAWYFANKPHFYSSRELYRLVPEKEKERMFDFLRGFGGSADIVRLHRVLYDGKSEEEVTDFLETLLSFYEEKKLVGRQGTTYRITQRGRELGVDKQSILSLDATEAENQLALKREIAPLKIRSREDVAAILAADRAQTLVKPIDITAQAPSSKMPMRFRFMTEVLYGNRHTDEELIDWVFKMSADGDIQPDFTIATGLVQGTFTGKYVDKRRTLADGLLRIDAQFRSAGILLNDLERQTKGRVFVVQGDDDWNSSESYAWLAQLAEGRTWQHGVNMSSLSGELERRLNIADYYKKLEIQQCIIQPYQYRIRRSLMNVDEVVAAIGVWKHEYRLIIEILLAVKYGFAYPLIYEKVVDVHALLEVARSYINQRLARKNKFLRDLLKRLHREREAHAKKKHIFVTPDSLVLAVKQTPRERPEEILQLVHNSNFSNITQYVDPLQTLERNMRHLGVRGVKFPRFILDAHQEFFYTTFIHGHWVGCLPGLQNSVDQAGHRMTTFSSRILSSKSHRQNTFRKSSPTPMVIDIEVVPDGRVRWHFYSNAVRRVLDEQRNEKHVRETICFLTDTQHGSITMNPEIEMKFIDFACYGREEGLATRIYENGDILQGYIYPAFVAENRPYRLVSVDSQQRFTNMIQMPLITHAPKVVEWTGWMGNHEWGIWGNQLTGQNALIPMEQFLQGYIQGSLDAGRQLPLKRAMTVNRIRLETAKVLGPGGGQIINHPYYSVNLAGFKVAMTHMWMPFGGGRTPVDQQRTWLGRMAQAGADIDVLLGGHLHSLWMAAEYDKLLIQAASTCAGQSGFELARGLISTVMCTIVQLDNKEGIMVEFVPWEFLEREYQFHAPHLRGRDKEFERPKEGTQAYEHGKMSPYIERVIDDVTRHITV